VGSEMCISDWWAAALVAAISLRAIARQPVTVELPTS
jgi:hypothetical protein